MMKTQRKIALDNTFRHKEVTMAIEIRHGKRVYRAETVDEALEIGKKLDEADLLEAVGNGEDPYLTDDHAWTADTVTDLLTNAGENQKLLLLLLHRGNMVPSDKIIESLGLNSEVALAGVLSGLSKQLKRMELRPWNLYTVETSWNGKEKTRRFKLVGEFSHAAEQLGWPDGWREYQKLQKRLEAGTPF